MDDMNPVAFGRLQAQVESLERSHAETNKLIAALTEKIDGMAAQLSEARGGWKTLMLVGGAFGGAGAMIATLVQHAIKGGGS
jgi:hypothetical protein